MPFKAWGNFFIGKFDSFGIIEIFNSIICIKGSLKVVWEKCFSKYLDSLQWEHTSNLFGITSL